MEKEEQNSWEDVEIKKGGKLEETVLDLSEQESRRIFESIRKKDGRFRVNITGPRDDPEKTIITDTNGNIIYFVDFKAIKTVEKRMEN